ncbi:MAG: PKD domain-containing protein [Bacteroidetes bacterium]|nr:PKD domain-containing protein [Bacteroidota bacterium]
MKSSTIRQSVIFFSLVFLTLMADRVLGQCSFSANQRTGCKGVYVLNLQNTTPGASNTNWLIQFPSGPPISVINNPQASAQMNVCGRVKVTMTTTVAGNTCTKVDSNFLVHCPPVIRGGFSTYNTCLGQSVTYSDQSTYDAGCGPLSYLIDWRQGRLDTVVPATRTYTQQGTYRPGVIVTDACGCSTDSNFAPINILPRPLASFTGTPLSGCASPMTSVMTATGGGATTIYNWYINGSTSAAQSGHSNTFSHAYTSGTYSIKLITVDSLTGCSDTLMRNNYITVGNYAAACFTTTRTSRCAPGGAQYCACTPGALSYTWNFPGASPSSYNTTSNGCVSATYASPGTYGAQLIVYYAGGCIDTMTNAAAVSFGQPLPVNFTTVDTYSCTTPYTVNLTYTGTPCASCTFAWNPAPNSTPSSHTGTSATLTTFGYYSPVLTVTDTTGCTSQLIRNNLVTVQPLKARTTVLQLGNGCVNDSFIVVNTTIGRPFTTVNWSFPGASTTQLSQDSMLIRYTTKGCHRYTLSLTNSAGCSNTLQDSICVSGKPSVSLTVYPHDVCYEQMCNHLLATVTGVDTPTQVTVWPQGLGNAATTQLTDSAHYWVSCYMYHDIGNFHPCFQARSGTCLGDTVCLTDSIKILAPAAQFNKVLGCNGSNTVTLTSTSIMADSLEWIIDGVHYHNQTVLQVALSGPCGTSHRISLTATNFSTGCQHTKMDSFIVPCSGVDFTTNASRTVCYPAQFRDTIRLVYAPGASVATSAVWSVVQYNGPPNFLTGNPAYTGSMCRPLLTNPAYYEVCVRLTYSGGCVDTLCKPSYIVISSPKPKFAVSDSADCSPFQSQFTNLSTYSLGSGPGSFTWSFGDGGVDATSVSPIHTYSGFNTYTAALTIVDTFGCSAIVTKQIVSDSVVANFAMSDTITCQANPSPLNPLTFTSTSTGYVAHYQWLLPAALGPTNPNPGDVPSFSCQFANEGSGNVCLVAIDRYNICRDTICKSILVKNPEADYTFRNLQDTANACPKIIINPLIDTSRYDICSYFWDFGDGSHTDTTRSPAHIYYRPGTYTITHIVESCHGCTDTSRRYTIHARGPVVHMTSEKVGGCGCTPVRLFLSSYDADSLVIQSDNGNPSFINMSIPRGTMANPTLDTVTITYCNINVYRPYVQSWQLPDTNCRQLYTLEDPTGDSIPVVIDTPTVDFADTFQACGSNTICFTKLTTYNSIYSYTVQRAWDFGDGTPADSTPNPCHTYAVPGDYNVTLSVRTNLGCTGSLTKHVHVQAPPVARLVMDDTIGCVPLLLQFRDSSTVDDSTAIVSGQWNIGYNNTVINTYLDTSYNYTVGGNYVASLTITDGYGCSDTAYQNIVIKPIATLNVGPDQTICLGSSATLSASGSPPLHWETNYNIDTTNNAAPVVTPQMDTLYVVRAGDVPRCYTYDTVHVYVSTITGSSSATGLCLGETTQFTATAQVTHSTVSSYLWSFGDGSTGSGQTVSHSYFTPGTYQDTLVLISALGCRDTVYNSLTLGDKPHAALSVTPASACLGTPVTVTNNSTAGISAPLAAFGIDMQSDGTPEFTTSPDTYTYSIAGTYSVMLVQTDVNGCTDTARQSVTVHRIPSASLAADTNCINRPNTITGNWTIGDGAIGHYHWTINGVTQPDDSAVIHRTFMTPQQYHVCLSVEDIYGCQSPDACNDIIIIAEPVATIDPNQDTTICLGYSVGFHVSGLFGSVRWIPPSYIDNPNSTDVVITPRQPMQYLVNIYYGHCTPKVDTVTVYVIDSVPVEASANPENIVLGLSSDVSSTVKGTIDSIVWDPDSTLSCRTCRNPIARPHQTTTYNATIFYSKNGVTCSNRASVTVTVITSCDNSLIYIPNTFTPNADGNNDVFRIRGQGITKVNYFRIYDRWGNLVHDISNADTPEDAAWNGGKHNDKARPENSGVFVYVFEVVCTTGQTISGKGNVTLIR